MANPIEDFLAKILGIGLVIAGVGWLIQWVCRKIADNAGPILAVVGCIAAFFILIAIVKHYSRVSAARKSLRDKINPVLSQLEAELKRQDAVLSDEGGQKRLKEMQSALSALS